jgi:hypothetical protein
MALTLTLDQMGGDMMLLFSLFIIVLLLALSLAQKKRYHKLGQALERQLKRIDEEQQRAKKLEDSMRDYVMGGSSLHEWKLIKEQVDELSGLPSFSETADEYVLRIHLSMTKKDDVRVVGIDMGISVSIESKQELPIQTVYLTPGQIDPSKLKVMYKNNIVEIRAKKMPEEAPKKAEEEVKTA